MRIKKNPEVISKRRRGLFQNRVDGRFPNLVHVLNSKCKLCLKKRLSLRNPWWIFQRAPTRFLDGISEAIQNSSTNI